MSTMIRKQKNIFYYYYYDHFNINYIERNNTQLKPKPKWIHGLKIINIKRTYDYWNDIRGEC